MLSEYDPSDAVRTQREAATLLNYFGFIYMFRENVFASRWSDEKKAEMNDALEVSLRVVVGRADDRPSCAPLETCTPSTPPQALPASPLHPTMRPLSRSISISTVSLDSALLPLGPPHPLLSPST